EIGALFEQPIADTLHEMGFAQAHAAVDEQWGVGDLVRLGGLLGGRACELVRIALDKGLERVPGVEIVRYGSGTGTDGMPRLLAGRAAADQNANARHWRAELLKCSGDRRAQFALDMIAHDFVGRHQVQTVVGKYGFQRTQPEVDILLGQAVFDLSQTVLPNGFSQNWVYAVGQWHALPRWEYSLAQAQELIHRTSPGLQERRMAG